MNREQKFILLALTFLGASLVLFGLVPDRAIEIVLLPIYAE